MCLFVIYNSEIGLITLRSLCISGNSDPARQTERGPQEGKCRETEVMVVQQQHACGGDIGLSGQTNETASEGIQVGGE